MEHSVTCEINDVDLKLYVSGTISENYYRDIGQKIHKHVGVSFIVWICLCWGFLLSFRLCQMNETSCVVLHFCGEI